MTCMACNTSFTMDVMCLAHQTFCPGIDAEKQETKRAMLSIMVGAENVDEVISLTRAHEARLAA